MDDVLQRESVFHSKKKKFEKKMCTFSLVLESGSKISSKDYDLSLHANKVNNPAMINFYT